MILKYINNPRYNRQCRDPARRESNPIQVQKGRDFAKGRFPMTNLIVWTFMVWWVGRHSSHLSKNIPLLQSVVEIDLL